MFRRVIFIPTLSGYLVHARKSADLYNNIILLEIAGFTTVIKASGGCRKRLPPPSGAARLRFK